jgi:hypothetical protein
LITIVGLLSMGAGCNSRALPENAVEPAESQIVENQSISESAKEISNGTQPDSQNDGRSAAVPGQTALATIGEVANNIATEQHPLANGTVEFALDPPAAPPHVTVKRLLIYTEQGPLIVHWWGTIDGRSLEETLHDYYQRLLQAADTDHDGQLALQEVLQNELVNSGRLGNENLGSDAEEMLRRRFDLNRNQLLDLEELPRFFRSATDLFQFRSIDAANASNDSQLLQLLDTDDDGVLSQTECESAAATLASYDRNQDRMLLASELSDPADQAMRTTGVRLRQMERGTELGSLTNWQLVQYALESHYASNYEFHAERFAYDPNLLDQIDENRDHRFSRDEVAKLIDASPQIIIQSHWQSESSSMPSVLMPPQDDAALSSGSQTVAHSGKAQLIWLAPALRVGAEWELGRDAISIYFVQSRMKLIVYATGRNSASTEPLLPLSNQQVSLSLTKLEDPLFFVLDQDMDQRLTPRELASAGNRLWERNQNQDDMLLIDEFDEIFVMGIRLGDATSMQMPSQLFASESGDRQLPAWFLKMDRNGDLEIGEAEFLGTIAQFRQMDANADGFLDWREIAGE